MSYKIRRISRARDKRADMMLQEAIEQSAAPPLHAETHRPTGTDPILPSDIGAETPAGAQTKADEAETRAKAYTDQEVGEVSQALNAHVSDGASHSKTARFVVGTSTSGWTEKDCDYLCDGTNDQVEINNAISALPASGGEVVILDGTYNITAPIIVNKDNVSIKGNGNATVLKRMWDSSLGEGVITLTSVEGCRVENLQIDGNNTTYTSTYNYSIRLHSSSNNNIVTANTCNNSYHGIYLSSSSNNNIVTSNTCNNNYHGIRLSSSSNNTVTGNTCNNNNSNGIRLDSSSNNTVTGNNCNNNNTNGIYLYSSSNNTITGNNCNNNNYGIHLYLSNNNMVTGNNCNNNNYSIFLSSSSNTTVTGNACYNNTNGIRLYLSSNNNTITGNNCNDNDLNIYLYSSSNNTITGNNCIRGIGTPEDYSTNQYTILLSGTDNNYNLISSNNCMGKAPVVQGGTGNTVFNNKWDASDDIQNIRDYTDNLKTYTEANYQPVIAFPTAGRPLDVPVGFVGFDTDLGLPIWWNGTDWIDASGNIV